MKHQLSHADLARLEKKINLLNDKMDRLMEVQGIALVKPPDIVAKEEEKMRKTRERKQAELLQKEHTQKRIEQMLADRRLQMTVGHQLRQQFNLVTIPSAARIREYQRTNSPSAFNGLKRNT